MSAHDPKLLKRMLRNVVESIQEGARQNVEIHGGLAPVGFLLARKIPEHLKHAVPMLEGEVGFVMVPAKEFFNDPAGKERYADLFRNLAEAFDAVAALLVSEVWLVETSTLNADAVGVAFKLASEGRLVEHPKRKEQALLQVESADGTSVLWTANLVRTDGRVRLEEWKMAPGYTVGLLTGFLPATRERAEKEHREKSN